MRMYANSLRQGCTCGRILFLPRAETACTKLQITLGRGRALRGVDASKLSEATTLKGKRMVGGRLRGELLEEADECGARVGTLVKFGPC